MLISHSSTLLSQLRGHKHTHTHKHYNVDFFLCYLDYSTTRIRVSEEYVKGNKLVIFNLLAE